MKIDISNISHRYPSLSTNALNSVSLTIQEGSLFGLIGPNGAGKTTLLSILSGNLPATKDSVWIDGTEINQLPKAVTRKISTIPQEYAFYHMLTVKENLDFFAAAQGLKSELKAERIVRVMNATALEDFSGKRAETLSGGLKRRLNIAIGLLNSPKLLFLDEPTVGIDPHSRHFILETIKNINQSGTTIIYTSHYMEEVDALCDHIAILHEGNIIKCGNKEALLREAQEYSSTITLSSPPSQDQVERLTRDFNLSITGTTIAFPFEMPVNEIIQAIVSMQLSISEVDHAAPSLEDLFLNLTGRNLMDAGASK